MQESLEVRVAPNVQQDGQTKPVSYNRNKGDGQELVHTGAAVLARGGRLEQNEAGAPLGLHHGAGKFVEEVRGDRVQATVRSDNERVKVQSLLLTCGGILYDIHLGTLLATLGRRYGDSNGDHAVSVGDVNTCRPGPGAI